jgi:polysaccharide export outer membrane protein
VVTVSLVETRPLEVYLIGEVVRPGRYALDPTATVLQALASAGGLTAFADRDRIFVLRRDPRPVRIRFRLESLTSTDGDGSAFRLLGGDTVVVE